MVLVRIAPDANATCRCIALMRYYGANPFDSALRNYVASHDTHNDFGIVCFYVELIMLFRCATHRPLLRRQMPYIVRV